MAEFIRKEKCPKCRENGNDASGDNLAVYDDGSYHCFACGNTKPSQEWLKEHGKEWVEEIPEVNMGLEFNDEVHNDIKAISTLDSRGYRGINPQISQYFGVRHIHEGDETKRVLYPVTKGYELVGYKSRIHPKNFASPYGEVGKETDMFGQHRFRTFQNMCLIVGGEHDQLAAYQMLAATQRDNKYDPVAVVSPTVGETSAFKQVQNNYEFFTQFKKIIIAMDNDEAGYAAMHKLAEVLPKGKVFVMRMRRKDPNSYIYDKETDRVVNHANEFISDFWAAQPYSPNGVVGSSGLMDKIIEAARAPKIPLPAFMHKAQSLMAGGIPLGRIVNLGAASGAGKSTIADECVYFWAFNSPYKIGVVSLESDAGEYGIKLLSRHIGMKIDLIEDDDEKMDLLNSPMVMDKQRELFFNDEGLDRFHLVDERDGGVESLKKAVENLVIKCGCKVIILDPLQDILDGLNDNDQALFLKWQKGLVKSHKVTFININHVRKSGGGQQANSTGADIHEEDFHGSSTIFKSAACNLLFTRNKEATDPLLRNVVNMKMSKCRWTGRTDPHAGRYFYENETHTMHDLDDYLRANPELLQAQPADF